jgi:hypothetical protein
MQAAGDFFGVPLVVKGEQAVENISAYVGVERPAHTLFGFEEVMAEARAFVRGEVGPAVGTRHGGVELAMQFAQVSDVVRRLVWIVKRWYGRKPC